MELVKLRQRIAEIAIIVGGINLGVLILAVLYAAVRWSYHTFPTSPVMVIAAWSGFMTVLCLFVVSTIIWLSTEETEEDVE